MCQGSVLQKSDWMVFFFFFAFHIFWNLISINPGWGFQCERGLGELRKHSYGGISVPSSCAPLLHHWQDFWQKVTHTYTRARAHPPPTWSSAFQMHFEKQDILASQVTGATEQTRSRLVEKREEPQPRQGPHCRQSCCTRMPLMCNYIDGVMRYNIWRLPFFFIAEHQKPDDISELLDKLSHAHFDV